MGKQLFANAASSLLAASISDTDLTIQVEAGFGALYPNPGAGEYFLLALQNAAGDLEIVKISSRSTDLLTVITAGRGQEGTSALAWTNGQTICEVRETKGTFAGLLQRSGDSMSGDLDMDANDIVDARLTGATVVVGGKLVGTAIRGAEGDGSNEILVPSNGSRATVGAANILAIGDNALLRAAVYVVGMVKMWFGAAIDVPTGWAICDGTSGTPDLRDRFVVGAGTTYALSATGGAAASAPDVTGAGGTHSHTGSVTDSHVLTEAEIPAHTHTFEHNISGVGAGSNPNYASSITTANPTGSTGGGLGHTHGLSGLSVEPDHTHVTPAVPTLPPYKALYYIMYVG